MKRTFIFYIRVLLLSTAYFASTTSSWAQQPKPSKPVTNTVTIDSIVVPFGNVPKNQSSAAISSVEGSKLTRFSVQRLSQALPGLIPGLTVINTGVEPGRESFTLRIRGMHSLQINEPLVFVDGFEAPMDQISVFEIDQVSIFKDAASLAPFGIRGANGVIWVTTKRGNSKKLSINLNSRTGISKATGLPSYVNSYDYARLYNEALSNDAGFWSPRYSDSDLEKYRTGSDPLFFPDVDWQKEIIKDYTLNNQTNISFDGSMSKMKYFVSAGYLSTPKLYKSSDEDGYLSDKSSNSRYNFRSNLDMEINKTFDVSLTAGGSITSNARPNVDNVWNLISNTPPNVYPAKNPDGSWAGNSTYTNNPAGSVLALGRLSSQERTLQTVLTLRENLDFVLPGLTLRESIGFDNMNAVTYNSTKAYARFTPVLNTTTGEITYTQLGSDDSYIVTQGSPSQMWRIAYQAEANYNKKIKDHSFSTALRFRFSQSYIAVENPPFNDIVISGTVNYDYKKKYFTELSLAYSGSENFGPGNRFGFFPAIAGGWNLEQENFLKSQKWINSLKIKGSVGLVGNSDIGGWRFMYAGYYPNGGNYILGNSGIRTVTTLTEGVQGNPNIKWEESMIANIGLEGKLFNNKLSFSTDVFYERRYDIAVRSDASTLAIIGLGVPYENIGKVNNKGLEASLGWNDKSGNFSYGLQANFSIAKNKIAYQDEILRRESYLYRTGKPIGQVFAMEAIGLFQSQAEIDDPKTPIHTFSPVRPGDIRYKDQNNDGIINEEDLIPSGYSEVPEIVGSIGAQFAYKGVDFSFLFSGVANRTLYLTGNNVWALRNNGQAPIEALNRWAYYPAQGIDTRSTATYPRLSATSNLNNDRISTLWLKNGNFLRLSNVEIGYTIPASIQPKAKLSNFRFYISGNNLLTFSKTGLLDPEALSGYPQTRSCYLGLNVNF